MRFWNRRETDLERELRAQRPLPREQFVQMLSRQSGAPKSRSNPAPGRAAPRIALVGAVTVVLAASLGVAGALGHAGDSVKSLGTSVSHIVQAPHPVVQSSSHLASGKESSGKGNDGKGNGGNNNGTKDGNGQGARGGNGDRGDDHEDHDPFHHEYHHLVPICFDHHLEFVPEFAYVPLLVFGHGLWVPALFDPLRCA